MKIFSADVERSDGGLMLGRDQPVENDLSASLYKAEGLLYDPRGPGRLEDDIEPERGNPGELTLLGLVRKDRLIDLYIPFSYEQDKIGVAAIRIEMKDVREQMMYLYRQCALIGLLIFALHLAFGLLFAKMILLPIRKLNEATRSIAS